MTGYRGRDGRGLLFAGVAGAALFQGLPHLMPDVAAFRFGEAASEEAADGEDGLAGEEAPVSGFVGEAFRVGVGDLGQGAVEGLVWGVRVGRGHCRVRVRCRRGGHWESRRRFLFG